LIMDYTRFKKSALPFGALTLLSVNSCDAVKNVPEKPNVIFIVLDDMNNYPVSGSEKLLTPNIDRLRRSSVTFTEACCAAPLSMPSRASLFTGIYPHNSGVYANGGDPWNNSEVLKKAETLPELFRRSGYYSFGRGKVYHAKMEDGRIQRNFDNRPVYEGGFGPFPDESHRVFSEKDVFSNFWGVQAFPDSAFPDVKNTDAVVEFLGQNHAKPFFITLGLWRPHTPFTAPQRFFDMYDSADIEIPKGYLADDLDDVPESGRALLDAFGRFKVTGANNIDRWKHFIHGYYACTSFADWNVGRVIDAVEKNGYAGNTIIVLFSDNGFHLGTKNHWEKNTLWDASAIVPLIIRIPGSGKGKIVDAPVGLIDLYPTMADYCGLEIPPQKTDGLSLRPFLESETFTWDRPAITSLGEKMSSVRSKKYRYIQYPDGTDELYDTENDPFEWKNLASEKGMQQVVKEHRKHIPALFMKELPGVRRN
jgi:arylsulfatase A-like enzyme